MKENKSLDFLGGNIEYFETLCNNLVLPVNGSSEVPHLILVTSCKNGEGVSTIAANLAVRLANYTDDRVLFVDANFLKPSAHRKFRMDLTPGLGEILMNGHDSAEAIRPSKLSNLFVLTAGKVQYGSTPKFNSPKFIELLQKWKHEYKFVVFDSPSLERALNSSVHLASLVDGVVLVIETERIRWEVVQRENERLVQSKAKILGVVLNKRKFHVPKWLYKTL